MTVEEFWEYGDKYYNEFEYGKPLVTKQAHAKLSCPLRRLHEWYCWGLVPWVPRVASVTPRVTEILIKSLKPQLSHKAREIKSLKFEVRIQKSRFQIEDLFWLV
jgi:hypothetical protein